MMDAYEYDESAPDAVQKPVFQMLTVYDQLIALKYHLEFTKLAGIKTIHPYYFISSTNSGEQYYAFVTLAAWLIKKCNRSINMPQESDDPNMVISGILDHARALGAKIDYTASKLKSGSGPYVNSVLSYLANEAVKIQGISYKSIKKDEVNSDDEDDVEILDDNEVNIEKIEEELDEIYSSDEEDNDGGWVQQSATQQDETQWDEQQKMLKSDMDVEAWRLEVERVLPQLKITVKTDGQDWRWRQEQMNTHVTGIIDVIREIDTPLKKLVTEAKSASDKVMTRENFLNNQFKGLLDQLHESQDKLSKMKEVHRDLSNKVAEKNKALNQLTEELDQTRKQLDDRGSIMADGAPVVTTRKNLNQLKKEFGDMEVDIGVMEHSLMKSLVQEQAILRNKNIDTESKSKF